VAPQDNPIGRFDQLADRLGKSQRAVVAGLILAMIILGVLIARNTFAQSQARSRAETEGDALLSIYRVATALLDLETGERGYILTRDPAYLDTYQRSRARIEPLIAEAQDAMEATGSEPGLQHLDSFQSLTRYKLRELDYTVALGRAGNFDVANSIVQAKLGKMEMDEIRQHLSAMIVTQGKRRNDAFDHARRVERRLLPLVFLMWGLIVLFGWASLVGERRRAATLARAEQADRLSDANNRISLLAGELNHRVKNLFAVVLSIVKLSGRKDAPAEVVVEDIAARIMALMQAHEAALENTGNGAMLDEVCRRTLAPYADVQSGRVHFDGPEYLLAPRRVTPLALIIHELATNAAKYGALSIDTGRLDVAWTIDGGELQLVWSETGGPPAAAPPDVCTGFGTRMTTMAAAQLGGRLERRWLAQGAEVVLTFPSEEGGALSSG